MRWTIFVLSSAMLVTARTRTERSGDFGLDLYDSRDIVENKDRFWSPHYQRDFFNVFNHFNQKTVTSDLKVPRKRALSALSRWKPLGSLGMRIKSSHRSSSRAPMISMIPEMNLVSAESAEGTRPLGQPLRWGRKR